MAQQIKEANEMSYSGKNFNIGKRYFYQKTIGKGAYGVVISAIDNNTQEKVAIKKLMKIEDVIDAKRVLREIKILRNLQHENIVQLKNIIFDEDIPDQDFGDIFLVTNYMEIDLYKVIRSRQTLTDEHIQYIIYQILRAIYYCHTANIIHRDLKPSNILADENCDVHICDFGLARTIEEEETVNVDKEAGGGLTEYVVTRYYRAPEIMLSSHDYNKPVDIWGVGCTMAELITGKVLFQGANYIQQIKIIVDKLVVKIGKPSKENLKFITNENALKYINSLPEKSLQKAESFIKYPNKTALNLLDQMLKINPQERITAENALKHEYFKGLHDPNDEPKFEGQIDFSFETDQSMTLIELRKQILQYLQQISRN